MTRTLLVTGAGGVGKTTIAAAVAVRAARKGLRTLVVTVDPARRLAAALGIASLGNEPQPHSEEPNLWAAMLDSSASWRAVAVRHADPEVATRLADNEFFKASGDISEDIDPADHFWGERVQEAYIEKYGADETGY